MLDAGAVIAPLSPWFLGHLVIAQGSPVALPHTIIRLRNELRQRGVFLVADLRERAAGRWREYQAPSLVRHHWALGTLGLPGL